MRFSDKVVFDDASQVRETKDGYIVAQPRVARTGIQLYLGDEVGKPDMRIVRVYRPEEEVFHADAMASVAHKPFTMGHPPAAVDATTWKEHAIGQLGDQVARDGQFLRVPLIMMDADAVTSFRAGRQELSLGYDADLDFTPGQTRDGEAYDAVQRNIRVNHLALVDTARGGNKLRIGDQPQDEDDNMSNDAKQRSITVDGVDLTMSDTAAAVVARAIKDAADKVADLTKQLIDAKTALDKSVKDAANADAEFVTKLKKKEEELEEEKKKAKDAAITPAKLDELVVRRVNIIQKGRAILGDSLTIDGKTDGEIMRQVVTSKLGDACKDWNDDQIAASFNTLTADIKHNTAHDAAEAFRSNAGGGGGGDKTAAAYSNYVKDLGDAWKPKAK